MRERPSLINASSRASSWLISRARAASIELVGMLPGIDMLVEAELGRVFALTHTRVDGKIMARSTQHAASPMPGRFFANWRSCGEDAGVSRPIMCHLKSLEL